MTEPNGIEIHDNAALAQMDDIASYATVRITIGRHPDNPEAMANTVQTSWDAPCYAKVADALRGIADEFDRRHDTNKRCRKNIDDDGLNR